MIGSVVKHVCTGRDKPWVIVGKGPSLDRTFEPGFHSRHYALTLNDACRRPEWFPVVEIAHFTDFEALKRCYRTVMLASFKVCMPWYPHVNNKPGKVSLGDWSGGLISELRVSERLLSYNSTVAHNLPPNITLPKIRVRYFSAVAAFNILAAAGLKEITTTGVDGGTEYAKGFDEAARLSNGRESFDVQFEEIEATCSEHGITYTKL